MTTGPDRAILLLQGIIQLGIVFMQMAPIAFSLAGEQCAVKKNPAC